MGFHDLKEQLIQLNYPNINILSDEQIAEVFNANNRLFFTTWVVNQIDCHNLPDDRNKLHNALADITHEMGFCKASQKKMFVNGDITLPVQDQLDIITRMLHYLKLLQKVPKEKKSNPSPSSSPQAISKSTDLTGEQLRSFLNTDLNLFPSLGPIRRLDPEQRKAKMETYAERYESLQDEIVALKDELDDPAERKENSNLEPISIDDLKQSLLGFQVAANKVCGLNTASTGLSPFTSDFDDTVKSCARNAVEVAERMKNLKTISDFTARKQTCSTENEDYCKFVNKIMPIVGELAKEE